MGMPGSVAFVAELTTLIAGFQEWHGMMALFCVSILIGATYAIRTITQLLTGSLKPQLAGVKDLHSYELYAAGILVAGILFFGLAPGSLMNLSAATINHIHTGIKVRDK
jgi:NADH-quinone oxidoreductase subunit M